ncbi:ribonuclease BN [Streptomyces sp. NPDC001380]|uniref:ribonuclease BN n=1 Tax=Streptomyces sp. NPDC001380 TaxID=3364566 RepID=UPI0036C57806
MRGRRKPDGPRPGRGRGGTPHEPPTARGRAAARRLRAAGPGRLWDRLSAVDFFGNSFQLAALAILCFFPFLIVVTAAVGQDAAEVLAGWLGLDRRAAEAVATLFKPGPVPVVPTAVSAGLLLLGAMAVAGTLQGWYRRVFDARDRGWRRNAAAQLCWLAGLLAYGAAQAAGGRALGAGGGPVAQVLAGLVLAALFWWWSMHVLLAGTAGWRELIPPALATAVCWAGLGLFSARFFSDAIVSNEQQYGPIGVVMVVLSWLIAVGVVVHLGSAAGRLYTERRARRRSGPADAPRG